MIASLAVLRSTAQAATLLDDVRLRILAELRTPDSAAAVARRLGAPRQRIGYHVRALEAAGLIESVGERRRGNYVEQLLQASATSYVVAPQVLGELGATSADVQDRFSTAYLLAAASRTIGEVAELQQQATKAGKHLATLTLETEVRFASASTQQAFGAELAECLATLVARYHDAEAPGGRRFRFLISGHPALHPPAPPSGHSHAKD
jgi:DNA-binding transcriptional ArsR family regulator